MVEQFLTCVSITAHVIAIGWTSVCLSVRPSVTRWYCIKTAEHSVMLSSPHDSLFILVLCVYKIFAKFRRGHPLGGALNRGGVWKYRNFRPITCYISEMVEDRWVYAARRFTSIESSFHPCITFTAIVPGAYPDEAKMCLKPGFHYPSSRPEFTGRVDGPRTLVHFWHI